MSRSVRFYLREPRPYHMMRLVLLWTGLPNFIKKYLPKIVGCFSFYLFTKQYLYLDFKYHDWDRTENNAFDLRTGPNYS
jgi:hypothetical protein